MLQNLLRSLAVQEFSESFEIIVVDNDEHATAGDIIERFKKENPEFEIVYDVEPRQGISYARNRSVAVARGKYCAFIDDDETASKRWLDGLYIMLTRTGADAVFGPVLPRYPERTPSWIIRSGYFERARQASGTAVPVNRTRTSNVLVASAWARKRTPEPFLAAYAVSGGEDHDFFKWMHSNKALFIWCDEAYVTEHITPDRCRFMWMMRRQFNTAVTYWRRERTSSVVQGILRTAIGVCGGMMYLLFGFLMLPAGIHRAVRIWCKAIRGFARLGSVMNIKIINYKAIP